MSVQTVKAIVNETELDLTETTTGTWEVTSVAPAKSSYPLDDHYYPVTVIATDEAGNSTTIDVTDSEFGEALQFFVKETEAPTIKIISPTDGEVTPNPNPTIIFEVYDDDSGVDRDFTYLKVNDVSVQGEFEIEEIEGGYRYTYVYTDRTLPDGTYTITVGANDNDGNGAKSDYSYFTVSTVAPSLSVTSPDDGEYFNTTDVTVSGTTDGVTVTVSVNGGEEILLDLADGEFESTISLAEGENTLVITATSEYGITTSVTRTVTVDTHAPIFKSVTIQPNPCDTGATYIITVEVVDDIG